MDVIMDIAEKTIRDTLGLRIDGEGRKNYSVQAGAGAGKTTMFSQRVCSQILAGTPIEEFVIVTYTNAAAAELREKITDKLREIVNSGCADDAEMNNARTALNSIELMQISTIHSFLFRILKENAFDTGVTIDCQMLETEEDDERKERFFNEWFHSNSKDLYDVFGAWNTKNKDGKTSDHTYDVFCNLFKDIANVRETIYFQKSSDYSADIDNLVASYIAEWKPHLITFKNAYDANRPEDKKNGGYKKHKADIQKIYDSLEDICQKTEYSADDALSVQKILDVVYGFVMKGCEFFNAKNDKASNDAIRPLLSFFTVEKEHDFDARYSSIRANWAISLIIDLQKKYQTEIDKETRVLSNDDILYRAEKLLTNNMVLLDKLRDKFTKIYVDEFQDTTDLQTRLIKLLAGKKGSKLDAIKLEDDKLIVVGDPKQSIYRFTGAEKGIYDEVNTLMNSLSNAESSTLATNFRSNIDIINWVNDKYGALMGGDYSPMTTDWVVSEKNALHGVYRYVSPADYKQADDVAAVVGIVKTLVENKQCFIEEIKRNSDGTIADRILRPIRYSDIMIITKVTTKLLSFVEAFGEVGIPVNLNGKFELEDVNDDTVLKNFSNLVKYLANRKDLKNKAQAVEVLKGIDVINISPDSYKKYSEELKGIIEVFDKKGMDPVSQIQYLLSHEELYFPHDISLPVNEVRTQRIRLYQMVETCVSSSDNNLRNIADKMDKYFNTEIKRENSLESNENAVRLMNVHQAKGLTGNIVIIADRRNSEDVRYGSFRKQGTYYPVARYNLSKDSQVVISSYRYDSTVAAIAEKEEAEEAIRLQYVAATRAAHALIFMDTINDGVWFTADEYDYDAIPTINEWFESRKADTTDYPLVEDSKSAANSVKRLSDLKDSISQADYNKLGEVTMVSITPSSLESKGQSGYTTNDNGYKEEARPKGNVFGDVLHRTCELIIARWSVVGALEGDALDKAITRIINQAILEKEELRKDTDGEGTVQVMEEDEEFQNSDHRAMYMSYLKSVLIDNDYIGRVLKPIIEGSASLYPEYEFGFYVPDSERAWFLSEFDEYLKASKINIPDDAAIYINGKADLITRQKNDNIGIYDYKSDSRNGKPLADFSTAAYKKYEGQMKLYRYAMSKSVGCSIDNIAEAELLHLYL